MLQPLATRFLIAMITALALATHTQAGASRTELLHKFVEEFDADEVPWSTGNPTVETLLLEAWSGKPDSTKSYEVLVGQLGIPESLVEPVLDAIVLSTMLADEWPENLNDKQRAEVRRAMTALEDAAGRATTPLPVVRSLLWLHDEWGGSFGEEDVDPLLEWLPNSFDPARIALEIYRGEWNRLKWSAGKESLLTGLGSRASHPALLYALSRSVDDPRWRVALAECAYHEADSDNLKVMNEARLLLAQNWVSTLLDVGLTGAALEALASLPGAIRVGVFEETAGEVALDPDGLSLAGSFEDIRLDLAAAFALEGDTDRASELSRRAAVPIDSHSNDEKRSPRKLQRRLLELFLRPNDSDPFGFFVDVVDAGGSFSDGNPLAPGTWRQLFATLAYQERYPSLAKFQIQRALNDLEWPADAEELPIAKLGADQVSAAARAATAVESLKTSLTGMLRRHAATSGTPTTDSTHDSLQHLIEAPPAARFDELPLPPEAQPLKLTDKQQSKRIKRQVEGLELPDTHEIVRVERKGKDIVAVGASQDYDPVGELSRGAYWILRSRDGGIRWDRPLYTGLRITLPYVIPSVSDLPLLRKDGLQLEVEIRELDTSFITFPPVGTRTTRQAVGLYLDIPWAVLERDHDEDGLTDLAEERLITDPDNADTDGDGLEDGHDPLPQVPLQLSADDRTLVLEALLQETGGAETKAIVHEVGGSGSPSLDLDEFLANAKRVALAGQYTTFMIGERDAFRGIHSDRRIVVLTPEEHSAATEKFGPIFATRVPLLMINRTRDRAFAIWSASWTGGQLSFKKVDGKWVARTMSYWIT